ncbi:MAG: hypothetical protein IJ484_06115 [Oscillospiraceae bacterium]|nr:hypothetical protein [Oscillospiraceae bacterium]
MSNMKVRGVTIQIGGDTSGLDKALKSTNEEIRSTQSELNQVERLLKLDPTNTTLLRDKQKLLGKEIGQTKTKLDSLKQAEKLLQQEVKKDDNWKLQHQALQREIVETNARLKELKSTASATHPVLTKVSHAAGSLSTAAGNVSRTMAPATAGVLGLGAAALSSVAATKELRASLSVLDANAKENAVGADTARRAWRMFAVQSGETDSAVEAVSNLLQAGFTESNLQLAVEGLAGAAQRFPDTLKVESLADSLQETLATGTATGAFAELLDRLGIGAENFSKQLARCKTPAEQQNLVLQTLANAGLNDAYHAWANTNEEMLKNEDANLRLQEAMASLAEQVLPMMTALIETVTMLINWFSNLDDTTKGVILTVLALIAAVSPIAGLVSGISGVVAALAAGPVAGIVLAIGALIAVIGLLVANWETVKAVAADVWDDVQHIWGGVAAWFDANIVQPIVSKLQWLADFANGILQGIMNFVGRVSSSVASAGAARAGIPMMATGGTLYQGHAIVGEAGPELLSVSGGRAIVTPLTTNSTSNHMAKVSIGQIVFNGYSSEQGDALVEDLNRKLGRLY